MTVFSSPSERCGVKPSSLTRAMTVSICSGVACGDMTIIIVVSRFHFGGAPCRPPAVLGSSRLGPRGPPARRLLPPAFGRSWLHVQLVDVARPLHDEAEA